MRDAIAEWWAASDDAPAARHTYLPCELTRHGNGTSSTRAAAVAAAAASATPVAVEQPRGSSDLELALAEQGGGGRMLGTSAGPKSGAVPSAGGERSLKRLAHHACNPSCEAYRARRRLSQECPCSP